MKLATDIWFGILGLSCVTIGLVHAFFGPPTVIGGGPVNATIDSDLRFYAVMFTAYGAAFVWCSFDIVRRARRANVLGIVFFAGGAARLLAWWVSGPPNWFYVLMVPVELLVPPANYLLLRRVCSTDSGSRLSSVPLAGPPDTTLVQRRGAQT